MKTIHFFGKPLSFEEAHTQLLSVWLGLATLSSDALSSVAYATDQIFFVLFAAGALALHLALPIALAIVFLLVMVTISYRQTIFVYKNGGGSYLVGKDNFKNKTIALIAAASLFIDYILTVSVSVTSGVEQITSAFPHLVSFQVLLSIGIILLIMYANLRGIKEAGVLFAIPTYVFIAMIFLTMGIGLFDIFSGHIPRVMHVASITLPFESLGFFLLLRALANGCTAMTGIEAISNGIPYFQENKSKHAATTMLLMSTILGCMFVGITFLAISLHAVPSLHETIISQLGRTILHSRALYLLLISSTTSILVLAANTSYADLPRLAAILATDGYLPIRYAKKGDRLAYSNGIITLTLFAILLVVVFEGHTELLIPLYAIGVFIGFTISQFGMVLRWKKKILKATKAPLQLYGKLAINLFGAILTACVLVVFSLTKFLEGAWITLVAIPLLVLLFSHFKKTHNLLSKKVTLRKHHVLAISRLHRQWKAVAKQHVRAIIFVDRLHRNVAQMLQEVMQDGISFEVVHFQTDEGHETKHLEYLWDKRFGFLGKKIRIVHAPYRSILSPMRQYLQEKMKRHPGIRYRVYVGDIVDSSPIRGVLHESTSTSILRGLKKIQGITIATSFLHV